MVKKNKERRLTDSLKLSSSIICEGSKITGKLSGDDDYVIYGSIDGECDLTGALILQGPGQWKGKILAENIVISGTVNGDVKARDKLELTSTARITGDITGSTVAIAEGAIFEGKISMTMDKNVVHFEERRSNTDSNSEA